MADGLNGQIRTLEQSIRNANDGIGFAQVADSGLGQVQNLLSRAASLLAEAESDTNSTGVVAIETELGQIYQEIDQSDPLLPLTGPACSQTRHEASLWEIPRT